MAAERADGKAQALVLLPAGLIRPPRRGRRAILFLRRRGSGGGESTRTRRPSRSRPAFYKWALPPASDVAGAMRLITVPAAGTKATVSNRPPPWPGNGNVPEFTATVLPAGLLNVIDGSKAEVPGPALLVKVPVCV